MGRPMLAEPPVVEPPVVEPPLLAIVGPTGSGKTELAMALADRLPVEILVADSRQVYRGMDIGTAKPDADMRQHVPHHLIDLVDPDEPFSVAQWVAAAREILPQIRARDRLPLLVGGTGLYVRSLIDGYRYPPQPGAAARRAELEAEVERAGLAALVARLAAIDPPAAERIDVRNPRRVLRALQRAEAGAGDREPRRQPYAGPVAIIGLRRPRPVLDARIDERAAWLFGHGLLDEVRGLLRAGYAPGKAPLTGHGYDEAIRHLAGEYDLPAAVARTAQRTRRYARRQLSWFEPDDRITWLDADEAPGDDARLVDRALALSASLRPD